MFIGQRFAVLVMFFFCLGYAKRTLLGLEYINLVQFTKIKRFADFITPLIYNKNQLSNNSD